MQGSGRTCGLAPAREQTETVSKGTCVTRLKRSSGALTGTRLRQGAPECEGVAGSWWLVAGGVRNTKDRDELALEVRAGRPDVGHTTWDAVGLSSINKNRVTVARTPVERGL